MSQLESIENLSTKDLEKLLKERKKEEAAKREKDKEAYEASKKSMVKKNVMIATKLHHELNEFREKLQLEMEAAVEKLEEYGEIRSNSKGGFTIKDEDSGISISRIRKVTPAWDERADKAEELLVDFFGDTIKKKDAKLASILMSYLQKNNEGKLRYSSVMKLMQHEDKYDDTRWLEAIRLLRESYTTGLTKYYYEFKINNEKTGEWETLNLNFNSL